MPIKVLSSQLLTKIIGAKSNDSDIILHLNESSGTGTGWGDRSIYSNGASFTGNVSFNKGLITNGINTTPSYAQGTLTSDPGNNFTISVTFEVYGNSQDTVFQTIFTSMNNLIGNPPASEGFILGYYDNQSSPTNTVRFFYGISGDYISLPANSVPFNTKTTFTVSWDGSNFKLYLNGVLQSTTPITTTFTFTNKNYRVGYWFSSYPRSLFGKVYDVILYNRTLSDQEVQDLYFKKPTGLNVSANSGELLVRSNRVLYVDASVPSSYTSGVSFYDLSGNALNGVISRNNGTGNLPQHNKFNGGYFYFDGTNSYISFSGTTLLPSVNNPSTVISWVRIKNFTSSSVQYRYIFSYGNTLANGARWLAVSLEDTQARFSTGIDINRPAGSFITSSNIFTDQWYQVSQVWDSTRLSLYVNGALIISKTGLNSNIPTTSIQPRIGMNSTQTINGAADVKDGFFPGDIAQVTLYNRALTAEEIWQSYKVVRHKFRADEVGVPLSGSGGPTVPSVFTKDATPDIYSATTGLIVTSSGTSNRIRQGILWSLAPYIQTQLETTYGGIITLWPTTDRSFDVVNPTSTNFDTTMSPLGNGSLYYYIAFAQNSDGIGWGEEKSFLTLTPGIPTMQALSSTVVSSTSVNLTGRLVNINGAAASRRGFVYSTNPITTLTQANNIYLAGNYIESLGPFFNYPEDYSLTLINLNPGQTYYFESFAENNYGKGFSLNGLSFVPATPASITISLSSTTSTTITINVTTLGQNITAQGIFYSTSQPLDYNTALKTNIGSGTKTGAPTSITGSPGTTFYIRGYVINDPGQNVTFSSPELQITLLNVPTVTMTSVDTIKDITTIATGTLEDDGGIAITQKGLVAATTQNPTLATVNVKSVSSTVTTIGDYQLTLSTLIKNTTYYVRAYAINSQGTAYSSNQLSFLTLTEPTPTTLTQINLTSTTVTLVGTIATNQFGNDTTLTAVGFQYYQLPNGTVQTVNATFVSGSSGEFRANVTGLVAATAYQYRAFATNTAPLTGYDQTPVDFTTQGTPPVFSVSLSSTGVSLTAVVTITNTGGVNITEKGIVWSTSPNPTVVLSTKTTNGAGNAGFTDTVTSVDGIVQNTTYYVVAYVVTYNTFYTTQQTIQIDTFPSLTLNAPTSVTNTSMDVSVTSVFDGRDTLQERGVVWATTQNPTTTSPNKIINGLIDTSDFSASLTSLSPGTTYYIRAYAINSVGTSYSAQQTKATNDNVQLITIAVTNINSVSADFGGDILNKGTRTINERGVAYSQTNTNPQSPTNVIDTSNSLGQFSSQFANLTPNTTYYVQAYAKTTLSGTYFGGTVSFKTLALNPPAVSIGDPTKSGLSFTVYFSSTGDLLTESGIVWDKSGNTSGTGVDSGYPTIADFVENQGSGPLSGNITVNTGLQPGTQYIMRAYAKNTAATVYSIPKTITLSTLPNVTIDSTSAIAQTTATVNCQVNNDGGDTVTERGLIYKATTATTDIVIGTGVTKVPFGSAGIGVYTINLTGLAAGTVYQIRAYAISAVGTSYSPQEPLTTLIVPTVTFTSQSNTDLGQVQVIANVTSDGGASLLERGVLYSTTVTVPTWASTLPPGVSKVSTTTALSTGSYTTNLTGLNQNTTYYIRAFARNNQGPGYAATQTIVTITTPTITTDTASVVTTTSMTLNANISSDGNCTITSRGFYFGTNNPPTNIINVSGGPLGLYSSVQSGLSSNTNYYFQAWCITTELGYVTGDVVARVTLGSALPIVISSSVELVTDSLQLLAGEPICYSIGAPMPAGSLGSFFFNVNANSGSGPLTEVGMVSKAGSSPDIGSYDRSNAFGTYNQASVTVTRGRGFVNYNTTVPISMRVYARNSSGYGYGTVFAYPMFSLSLTQLSFKSGKLTAYVNRNVMLTGYSIVSQGISWNDAAVVTTSFSADDPYFTDTSQIEVTDASSGSPGTAIDWDNNGTAPPRWTWVVGTPISGNIVARAFIVVTGGVFGTNTKRYWSNGLNLSGQVSFQ